MYLETLLEAEMEERERNVVGRRLKEAHFPKVKTLEEFNFEVASHLPAARLRKLAEGQYIDKTEPLVFHRRHRNREDASGDGAGEWRRAGSGGGCGSRRRPSWSTT